MDIIIETNPVSQLRPRISGNRMYDPKKVRDYKKYVAWETKRQWKKEPLQGKLAAHLVMYRTINKGESNIRRKKMELGEIRPVVTPDVDNYTKAILDALNGITYEDDSQIVDLFAQKFYSKKPRIEIKLTEME